MESMQSWCNILLGGTLTNGFLHFICHLLAFLFELLDHVLSQLSITPRSVETSECVGIAGTGVVLCQQYYYHKNTKKNSLENENGFSDGLSESTSQKSKQNKGNVITHS